MEVADLVLPVFAVIVTGWLAGWLGYISRLLADGLVHFAYNVAMPALLFITVPQEPARNLLEWRFLMAFGGSSILCFALVFLAVRIVWGRDLASSTIQGMTAAMTNTGFVALPILHSIYGQPAVLPAAIATVFVAAVMFPASVILLESGGRSRHGSSGRSVVLVKQIALNPMVLSTLVGLAWAIAGWPVPAPIVAYLNIFAAALTPCALFAIGLGLSVEAVRSKLAASLALTVVKLVAMPLVVYGLCVISGLNPLYTIAAVVCAAVPTAKTVFILAGEYKVEEELVTATVSITTLLRSSRCWAGSTPFRASRRRSSEPPELDHATNAAAATVDPLNDPAVRKQMENLRLHMPKDQLTPQVLGDWQKAEIAKWWPMIKAANVKVD